MHSSDKLREEMYGDNYDDADNSKVFEELHRRILEDLKMHSVIYDATNLVKKRRVHFLKGVPKHVYKTCIMFLKTYEKCLKDNSKRENSVPDEVITRMRKVFSPPMYHEGFNEIRVVQDDHKDIKELIDMARDFDQENPHHSLTLYEHLKKVSEGVPREEKIYGWRPVSMILESFSLNQELMEKVKRMITVTIINIIVLELMNV